MTAAAVILAAGAGRRLGGAAKALLRDADNLSFLEVVASRARRAGVTEIAVVVGPPYGDEVAAEAERLNLDVVRNPNPERGMASSVALGFAHLIETGAADAALLWPVDHAAVTGDTVAAVLAADSVIAVPTYGGRGGHPTLFRAPVWPELVACAGAPDGARSVVRSEAGRVIRFAVDDPGVVADVDVPEALG